MSNTYPNTPPASRRFLTTYLANVSAAGQIYVAPGFRGKIIRAYSALNAAIGTADAVLTLKIGGTAVTGGTITIAYTESAAGDIDSCTPTALATFNSNQAIEIETSGASTNAVAVMVTLEVEPV